MKTKTAITLVGSVPVEDVKCPPDVLQEIDREYAPETDERVLAVVRTPLHGAVLEGCQKIGCMNLMKAVAAQAIDDYRALSKAGLVKGRRVVRPWKKTKIQDNDFRTEAQATELLHFLSEGLDRCLGLAEESIHPDYIRKHIGFN